MNRERTLSRDVTATQIPSGDKQTLTAGSRLFIHQTLGGSYTVQTDFGLFRIDGRDGDSIGEQVVESKVEVATLADGAPDPVAVWDQLKKVYDPEIPVNIVDLGLVYSMDIERIEEPEPSYKVHVAMTLTAPGCGMGPVLVGDVEYRVAQVPNVRKVAVELVFDPPWHREMMSEEAQLETGMFY